MVLLLVPPPALTAERSPLSAVVKGPFFHFLYFFLPFPEVLEASDALYSVGGSQVIAIEVDVKADARGWEGGHTPGVGDVPGAEVPEVPGVGVPSIKTHSWGV